MAGATWADVLRDGLTTIVDGARDVFVAREDRRRTEQYPPGYPYGGTYGPYAGGYRNGWPGGTIADPWNTGAYPETGGWFGLSQGATQALLIGAAVLAVVLAVGD